MNNEIKVLLVDDHAIMRKGVAMLLSEQADITVVGEAEDGEQAIERVRALQPDVVVMDISMPKLNGIEATRQIVSESPGSRVIALSIHSSRRFVDDMLKAGAAGYLLKESVPEELIQSIHAVMQDKKYLSSAITGTVLSAYLEQVSEQPAENESATDVTILKSKLYPPTITADIIPRPMLMQRLETGRTRPLILVSAPAGYGKSTLISNWLQQTEWASAWISLDADDGDLRQFMSYFLFAVQSVFPGTCKKTMELIKAPQLPPMSSLVSNLSNELDALDQPFILAIDDYHLIDVQSPVNQLLQLLLEHPPIPLHLVITTRRDPALSLVTLRGKGQVNEIRMQELRFASMEARALLESTTGVTVSNDALNNLDRELEGWVVGLRLVSLVVSKSKDPEGFLKHLHGGLQHIQEYMVQEVIAGLPQALRDCLLKTAILDRFCAPLCDAVCQQEAGIETPDFDGDEFIKAAMHDNLFVIKLGNKGKWMRYHHLFQEFLQRQLTQYLAPGEIAALHLRASGWFESQGLFMEAIEHALAAGDDVRAAEIVEANRDEAFVADQWFLIDRWLAMLPAKIKWQRPKLLLTEAWIANLQHQMARVPRLLEQAESLLTEQTSEPSLLGELAFFHGYVVYWDGQAELCRQFNEDAVSKLSGTRSPFLGEAELMLGLARCMAGQTELAVQALENRIDEVDASQGQLLSRCIASLVFIRLVCGDLMQARADAQRLQIIANKFRMRLTQSWSSYMLACSHLHNGELETALGYFVQTYKQRYVLESMAALDALVGMALTQQLLQLDDEAMETAGLLAEFVQELKEPQYLSMVDSCYARIALLRGEIKSAADHAQMISDKPTPANLFMWLESPPITKARVLIASGSRESLQSAMRLLGEIRQQSEAGRFTCQTIEVAVLESLLLDKQGNSDAALITLQEALTMAEPGVWIRPFIELGRPMAELLGRFAEHQGMTDFLHRVLDAFQIIERQAASAIADNHRADQADVDWNGEQLTNRELDILELLAQRLQNKEIASRLFVSPETVKTHLKHLFQKLDVNNRREAAARADVILASTRRL